MFERFTEHARQVVVLAQEEARILRHKHIGTEHILLGLLREKGGLAPRVLESLDLTVEPVRAQVVRMVGPGEEVASGQLSFTPRARKVLEMALHEALALGHNYIGTEHILLGLAYEKEGLGARILLEFDADSEKIRREVIRLLGLRPRSIGQAMLRQRKQPTARASPARSADLRLAALARGNQIRALRARLKRDMKARRIDPAALFLDPPDEIQTAKVVDLLLAVPRFGRVKANRALTQLRIAPSKTVGGLSKRQRLALAELLRDPPRDEPANPGSPE